MDFAILSCVLVAMAGVMFLHGPRPGWLRRRALRKAAQRYRAQMHVIETDGFSDEEM